MARERVVPLGGLSALLLQLAHPLVAAAVAGHSRFQDDPLKRLTETLEMLLVTTFGDVIQANAMARRVANIHRSVNGALEETVGEWPQGSSYSARDSELCLWVHATIIETTLNSFSTFVRPLDAGERAKYYQESESFGQLFGVGMDMRPATYEAFQEYYAKTLSQLTVGRQSRAIARSILRARLHGIPVSPWGHLLAAGLLPARLRAEYGVRWSITDRTLWWLFKHLVHIVMCRLAPGRIRFWNHYHVALKRCRDVTSPSVPDSHPAPPRCDVSEPAAMPHSGAECRPSRSL
ncbi:MAG: oxygenase MpaB family protein [Streptosporangiaceae bacterium]